MNLGIRRTAVVLATMGIAVATAALPAAAETATVVDGSGDWGVKLSFRNYINGPIAQGTTTLSDGVVQNTDGTYAFPILSGDYDSASGDATIQFGGKVAYEGHGGLLTMTIEDIRIEVAGGVGELYADVSSKSLSGSGVDEYPNVNLADLDLSGGGLTIDGDTLTLPPTPATLTEAGVPAFADFYPAGADLDPLSFTATVQTGGGGTDPDPQPGGTSADQQILAEVAAGPLTLSVAGDSVRLSRSSVSGDGLRQNSTGALNTATVSDLRGTQAGWNLVGQVSDFVGDVDEIAATNLGWKPIVGTVKDGLGNPGAVIPGAAVLPGDGLGSARTLASAAPGDSAGTFTADAALELAIPAGTAAGDYAATLTLTLS